MDQLPTIERWMNTCEWGSFRPEVSTSGIIQENDRQTQKNEKKHRSWWKCHGNCSWSDVIKFSTAAVRDKRLHLGRRVARCKNCARTGRVSHVKLSMTCKWVSFGCWRIRPSRTISRTHRAEPTGRHFLSFFFLTDIFFYCERTWEISSRTGASGSSHLVRWRMRRKLLVRR